MTLFCDFLADSEGFGVKGDGCLLCRIHESVIRLTFKDGEGSKESREYFVIYMVGEGWWAAMDFNITGRKVVWVLVCYFAS